MKIYLFSIILLMLLISCKQDDSVSLKNSETITIKLNDASKEVKFSDIIDTESIQIVPLETIYNNIIDDGAVIGSVNKVLTTKKYILILDIFSTESIFLFKRSGEFVRKIGTKGSGPEEYSKPLDILIIDNEIKLLDNSINIITYDFYGNFISKSKIENSAFNFEKMTNDHFALISGGSTDNLIIVDNDLKIKQSYFPFISRSTNKLITNPLYKNEYEQVIYRRFLNDTLFFINENNNPQPYRIFDYEENAFDFNSIRHIENIDEVLKRDTFDYCITRFYYENKTHGLLGFILKDELWFYFHSKTNNNFKLLKYKNFINDVSFDQSSYILSTYDDYFVLLVEPNSMIEGVEQNSNNTSNLYEKMKSLSEQVQPEDNPILIFIKLKI